MKIFLLKDIPKVGIAGELIKVSDGFAKNFILPNKMGVIVTPANQAFYAQKIKTVEQRKEVISSQTSMLAQKIKDTTLTIAKKMDDQGKLYGSVSEGEIVALLAQKGIVVTKSQIEFDKSIKAKGSHSVTIKLSSRLKPDVTLKVVAETASAA